MAGGMLNQAQAAAGAPAGAAVAPTVPELAQAAAAAGATGPAQAGGVPQGQPGQTEQGQPVTPVQMQGGMQGGMATGDMEIGEEAATPEEQKEYERGMQALSEALYSNEKVSNSIVDQVDPNDKVSSTSKVSMLFIQQLDEQINLDEAVVAQMTQETVSRIMELAEARHQIQYDEREAQVILSATWEGISQMFGTDEADHAELVNSIGAGSLPELKSQYEAALNG